MTPDVQFLRFFVTARKRSLGQGNMFTGVCVFTGGGAWSGGAWSQGVPGPGGVPGPRGCLVPAGCLVWGRYLVPGGVPGGDPPGRLLLRALRILLECILVLESATLLHKILMMNYLECNTLNGLFVACFRAMCSVIKYL